MANLICELIGNRGRSIKIYDNKCEIRTEVTAGSVITGNATDGVKTIFYIDCAGVQFKESGALIGYLQMETPSMQMNNQKSNFWSENTFTFEDKGGTVTNQLMRDVYKYITDRMEGYKYNDLEILQADLPASLAKLYGKPRPQTKEEILKEEKERLIAEEERKKEIEQAREDLEKRFAEAKEKVLENGSDQRVEAFLAEIENANRCSEILSAWTSNDLNEDLAYTELTEEIKNKAEVERIYGLKTNRVAQLKEYLGEKLMGNTK